MSYSYLGSRIAMAVVVVLLLPPATATGQAPTVADETWHPPRTPDGQPDMQGYWSGTEATTENIEVGSDALHDKILGRTHRPTRMIVDPPDRQIPYQPWAEAKAQKNFEYRADPTPEHLDPVARCYLPGVPRITYMPFGFQILQPPGYVVVFNEAMHTYRIIPVDGRPHVGEDIRLWMGDSRGRWEGQTLVVDVTNSNGKPWLDMAGNFASDALHVIERWTVVAADTLRYEATMVDPKVYTRPWTIAFIVARNKEEGYELMEGACYEGNRVDLMLRRSSTQKTGKNNR